MRRSTLTTGLYLALLFLSGVAVGIFGHRLYTINSVNASVNPRNPEEFRRRYVAEMRSRLKLTDDQVARLGPILDETRQRHHELVGLVSMGDVNACHASSQAAHIEFLNEFIYGRA